MLEIIFAGKTDVGRKRTNNEDVFTVEPKLGFCLVADGLGGAAAGELASRIFLETALEVFQNAAKCTVAEITKKIQIAFAMANENILQHTQTNPAHKGMGCTAELMAFYEEGFVLGHIGDSRTYRYRNGQFIQLTRDHSLVQEQIDKGLITPENARNHPLRNVIHKAVGIDKQIELDIVKSKVFPRDQYLLCSDGLTDMVADDMILEALKLNTTLNQKVDRLIEMALSAGGGDNVSVVVLEIVNVAN
jgi:serine/threonine protein phosphatase PrpC